MARILRDLTEQDNAPAVSPLTGDIEELTDQDVQAALASRYWYDNWERNRVHEDRRAPVMSFTSRPRFIFEPPKPRLRPIRTKRH